MLRLAPLTLGDRHQCRVDSKEVCHGEAEERDRVETGRSQDVGVFFEQEKVFQLSFGFVFR